MTFHYVEINEQLSMMIILELSLFNVAYLNSALSDFFVSVVYVAHNGLILTTLTLNCIQYITQSCYSRQYLIFTHILCYFQSLENHDYYICIIYILLQ